jgi:hypothetical protein
VQPPFFKTKKMESRAAHSAQGGSYIQLKTPRLKAKEMSRIRLLFWSVLFMALWSCRKDVEQFESYAPSAQDLSNWLVEQVPNASNHSTFTLNNLASDKVLETLHGTRIFLTDTDHLFADMSSGLPVLSSTCPDLKIEVTEVLDKSDIVARGLNTIGDSGLLFESAGLLHITATCNGQLLTLLPDRNLKIQLPNSSTQNGFFVFTQGIGTTGQWSKSNQQAFEANWLVSNGNSQNGYELLIKSLGWVACGRPLTDPSSSFCIALPSGFADQNTLAYMVFKNQQVVAPLRFNLSENQFCYPKAPTGYQVQLLAVSKLGERYWLGRAETEVGANATVPMGTQESSVDVVLNFIKSL